MPTKKLMYLKIVFAPLLHQFWSVWNDGTHMYKSLVFGDEFVSHLKSHQRCSAGIRPVKFFHTDWIIISLWFLSYLSVITFSKIKPKPGYFSYFSDPVWGKPGHMFTLQAHITVELWPFWFCTPRTPRARLNPRRSLRRRTLYSYPASST